MGIFTPQISANTKTKPPAFWKPVIKYILACTVKSYWFIYFWWYRGLNSGLCTCKAGTLPLEPQLQSKFFSGYFGDGVFWTISLSWPWTAILIISSPQEARIAGMSYQHRHEKLFIEGLLCARHSLKTFISSLSCIQSILIHDQQYSRYQYYY
jgi:hypothetical protein